MLIDAKNIDPHKDINLIRLHLDPKDANFKCFINRQPGYYTDYAVWTESEVSISFRDSHELDSLIDILQRFRDNCHGLIGNWMEVPRNG